MAMLLTYLKTTAENAISTKVADCVISVCVNVQFMYICWIFMKFIMTYEIFGFLLYWNNMYITSNY